LNAINDVKHSRDPQHVVRDPASNRFSHLQVFSEVIEGSVDWKQHIKERIATMERIRSR
jgi:hypothetical protein